MKILLIGRLGDPHIAATAWGLRNLGHDSIVWNWGDYPQKDISTTTFDDSIVPSFSMHLENQCIVAPFDVIWYKRSYRPTPRETSSKFDQAIIKRESFTYLNNIRPFLGHEKSFWINDWQAAHFADNKINQLSIAKAIGFKIPSTIMSNDPVVVRRFFAQHQGKMILKPFLGGGWSKQDGTTAVMRTSIISASHLENDEAIMACPGIFQELIEKDFELRVTIMGDFVFSGAILSQIEKDTVDWRYDLKNGEMKLKVFALPQSVKEKCLRLCREMNLVFGCIDLIVNKQGEYIFLEINESGQFLWKEDVCSDMLMLDGFCHFIASKGRYFSQSGRPLLRMVDFDRSDAGKACLQSAQNSTKHGTQAFTSEDAT